MKCPSVFLQTLHDEIYITARLANALAGARIQGRAIQRVAVARSLQGLAPIERDCLKHDDGLIVRGLNAAAKVTQR